MEGLKQLQLKIKGFLYEYGLGATAEEIKSTKYFITKAIDDSNPDMELLEKLTKHFENKEAQKRERLEKLLA